MSRSEQRQRTVIEVLLAQLQVLLAKTLTYETRRDGAQWVRRLAVALMSQTSSKDIVVSGVTIHKFESIDAKRAYLNKMSQNGAWLDDTCMKALAVGLDVNLRVHVVDTRINGGAESLLSYSLNSTTGDRPQLELINYGQHATVETQNAGAHWESAIAVAPAVDQTRQCVRALAAPSDGNCGAYAVFDALMLQQRNRPLLDLAEHYNAKTTEIIVNEDSRLIRQHTQQAEQLITTAINQQGISFDRLLSIAKQLVILKHGENDTYLQGHIDRLVAGPHNMGATMELGRVMAVRAGIDGDLFETLQKALKNYMTAPPKLTGGASLFAPSSAAALSAENGVQQSLPPISVSA